MKNNLNIIKYQKESQNKLNKKFILKNKKDIKILLLLCKIFIIFSFFIIIKRREWNKGIYLTTINKNYRKNNNFFMDLYETHVFNKIKLKLETNKCGIMWDNQREFLNGVIRKFKPKKIVEIGVAKGGGSCIILNAIQDIKNAHLYSIDLSNDTNIGICVKKVFPEFLCKWTLFQNDIAAKFMEQIGNNIDMVFIDSAHFEPGEILDFLIVLPFLKEGAIVGFHDIGNQITKSVHRNEWAPYIIFNMIRGKTYLPSGDKILKHDIGIKILDKNQNKYVHDYVRALGGQWQYFPKEKHIRLIKEYFKKYYDDDCFFMLNETVEFNRNFVKNNIKGQIYKYNSES